MLPSVILMLVLSLLVAFSARACDDLILFEAWSDESEQASGPDRPLVQTRQKESVSTNAAKVAGNVRTHAARAKTQGRDYNARSTELGQGRVQTTFHAKWINYLDENLTWREIDPGFVKTASGFEMTKAPFEVRAPLTAQGTATFINNSGSRTVFKCLNLNELYFELS